MNKLYYIYSTLEETQYTGEIPTQERYKLYEIGNTLLEQAIEKVAEKASMDSEWVLNDSIKGLE